jgi:hypothetical protein
MTPSFFAYAGSLQYDADFLFAGYNPILVEAKLIFLNILNIYRQDDESRKLAWWQEKGSGYLFRNKKVCFRFLEI